MGILKYKGECIMKQEKSLLMENLNLRLISLNNTGRIKELINSDLLNDYMPKGVLTKYLNTKMPLNNLNTSELFHITRLINLYEHKIDIDEYFTDTEINEAMESKNKLKNMKITVDKADYIEYTITNRKT